MKYALIGCGRIAPNHIGSALDHKLNIQAVCDVKEEKAAALLTQYGLSGVQIYTDYRKMLDDIQPDLVAVATESGYHAQIAIDCIRHGCNVIIEKPLALSMEDARRVIAARDEMGVVACINQQNRFNAPIQLLRKDLEEGRLGKLFHGALQMHWMRDEAYYDKPSWRGTYALDGGALMNQCIHGIDLLRWMMGGEPTEVMAVTDNLNHPYIEAEDMGLAIFKFKNGSYGVLEGSVNTYPDNLDETLSIYAENGTVRIGGVATNKLVEYHVKEDARPFEELSAQVNTEPKNVYGFGHSFLYADVIDAIRNHRAPYVPLEEGMKALEMVLAVYKSAAEGRPVAFPLGDYSTLDVLKQK
ncbi:MAG TPA: Gfo/Idh/MocA family oxidoreductase [Candidatus Merdivicinus excrementipullorum]|uniref:Gfo/Idh/MocA family oxidoreductase n=1 Tax=Candidatus Merdivicinus excrementipullorum TaxID=2840867 RepID=A0A9D1JZR2_9FIRM|nr:Gfo/Idh/MocA family oxidoreductase [Candidatus Merdivicinus excrementipullorum]